MPRPMLSPEQQMRDDVLYDQCQALRRQIEALVSNRRERQIALTHLDNCCNTIHAALALEQIL